MAAQTFMAECRFCKGSGKAQSLMELSFNDEWVPNKQLPHELADALIKDGCTILRWDDCDCPVCGGKGEYLLESVQCKVF